MKGSATCVDVGYLDLADAFDNVPHQYLAVKLKGYAIENRVLAWRDRCLSA